MDEQRKYAILFAATILAARKLSDPHLKRDLRDDAITDAVVNAAWILEEIDLRWPNTTDGAQLNGHTVSLSNGRKEKGKASFIPDRIDQNAEVNSLEVYVVDMLDGGPTVASAS